MTDERYNGWTNYETWNVKLWMDNDEPSYRFWQEETQEAWDNADAGTSYDSQSREDHAIELLTARLQEEIERPAYDLDHNGLYTDLLNAALSSVNWREIAQSLMEDVEKEIEA